MSMSLVQMGQQNNKIPNQTSHMDQLKIIIEESQRLVTEISPKHIFSVRCHKDSYQSYYVWDQVCQQCQGDHDQKYYPNTRIKLPAQIMIAAIDVEEFRKNISKKIEEDTNNLKDQMNNNQNNQNKQGKDIIPPHFKPDDKNLVKILQQNKAYFINHLEQQYQNLRPSQQSPKGNNYAVVNWEYLKAKTINLYETQNNFAQLLFFQKKLVNAEVNQKNTKVEQLRQEIINLKNLNSDLRFELIQQEEQLRSWQISLQSQEQSRKKQKEKDETPFIPVEGQVFYDFEINCQSILQLTTGKGWNVKIDKQKQILVEEKAQSSCVVSFYGLYNKGKSFLASKLSGKQLPRGFSVSTVGLSALYPDQVNENQIIYLDTAGTETPISYNNDENGLKLEQKEFQEQEENKYQIYEYKLKDRLLTEHLIQRFILEQSNLVMIVVDQLTKEEQRIIQKIKNLFTGKSIIIVHNFSKLTRINDVEKYIQQDIEESFNVFRQKNIIDGTEGFYYIEQLTGSKTIQHVILALEGSEAGVKYNDFCYKWLKSHITSLQEQKKFKIVDNVIEMLKLNLKEIVDFQDIDQGDKDLEIKLNKIENGDSDQKYDFYKITCNKQSSYLKNISFDLLGDLKVFQGTINPRYQYELIELLDQQSQQKRKFLIFQIEVSGKVKAIDKYNRLECKLSQNTISEWHGFQKAQGESSQVLYIQGIKVDFIDQNAHKYANDRVHGHFKVLVRLDPEKYPLSDDLPEFTCEKGILQLKYVLQNYDFQEEDPPLY